MGDSKFTVHHTNSFSVSGDVLALEAHRLKAVVVHPDDIITNSKNGTGCLIVVKCKFRIGT